MKHQQRIVNFIALIVILTIGIQVYWNFIQYKTNRRQVINEIQNALDESVTNYSKINTQKKALINNANSLVIDALKGDSIQKTVDRILTEMLGNKQPDSLNDKQKEIGYTLIYNSVNLTEFDLFFRNELLKKNYSIDYNLTITEGGEVIDSLGTNLKSNNVITAQSQITPIESISAINLHYVDPILPAFLKGLTGLILSLILSCIVIFALYYLLHIIKKQKQISEIKNDFISNVTHEFKTPIAIVSSAIEAIRNFNNEKITEKSMRYLEISEQQLTKLNLLVEKVMETSLLESSSLVLDKQEADIIKLLKDSTEKHQLKTQKEIIFESDLKHFETKLDEFHFDNAISNIIDNAIKYGGNEITVSVKRDDNSLTILMKDNGEGISQKDAPYIFDKFYRVSNHNSNKFKGFGIGLYYARNIIEKHNGSIKFVSPNTFLITLWIR